MSGPEGDKILVTGAMGQIGTELVEALRQNHGTSTVIASDIRTDLKEERLADGPYVSLDVLDTDSIVQLC
ncbi:MAG TPA: NAD-dependent epimerase/dehydratase family protein, partial [Candidatus Poseidoniales archaeon]